MKKTIGGRSVEDDLNTKQRINRSHCLWFDAGGLLWLLFCPVEPYKIMGKQEQSALIATAKVICQKNPARAAVKF